MAMNISNGAAYNGGMTTLTIYGGFTNNGTFSSSGTVNFSPASARDYQLSGTSFKSTGTINFNGSRRLPLPALPVL